jgi:hypothetical protein
MRIREIFQEASLKSSNPCWKGYHPVGTKKKSGKTVPNCVPTNEGGGGQQAAIAIAKKASGKYTKDGKRLKEGWQEAVVQAGQQARKAVDKAVGSIPRPFDEKEVASDLRKSGTADKPTRESYGRYYCSTDKKWKTRQGPKQHRSAGKS